MSGSERLDEQVAIRTMTADDLPEADRLRAQVGFNQRVEDWQNLLEWDPAGCHVAVVAGAVVGTATTTRYGQELAWIGMLLVDERYRRRAIGASLLDAALQSVHDVRCVGLDATPVGRELYRRHGFVDRHSLSRWQGAASADGAGTAGASTRSVDVGPMLPTDLAEVMNLDRAACGVDRTRVLHKLHASSARSCWTARRHGELVGFALTRPGSTHHVVGPLTATDHDAASELLGLVLNSLETRSVVTDVVDASVLEPILISRGLVRTRPLIRMSRAPLPAGQTELCHAIAGPEIG